MYFQKENYLACGDGNCIERGLFCNGAKDCNDGSDENACGKNHEFYVCFSRSVDFFLSSI